MKTIQKFGRPLALMAMFMASATPALAHNEGKIITDKPTAATQAIKPIIAFEGGQWFDGQGFKSATWYSVDGRLTRIKPKAVDVRVNLKSRYIVPPLAEAHNHNLQNSWGAATFAPDYLKRGIFYSAQLAATSSEIRPYRGLFNQPGSVDVLFAEVTISSSTGHPLGLALSLAKMAGVPLTADEVRDKMYVVVDTADDLAKKWDRVAETGAKLIKVILVDGAHYEANHDNKEKFGRNGLNPALLPEIVKRAHAMGARVAVHTDTAQDFAYAADAGVDIIAHLPGYRIDDDTSIADYRLSDAAIASAARNKVAVIPTAAASKYYLAKHPDDASKLTTNYRDNMLRLKAAGVTMVTGSDLFDGSVNDEIEKLDAVGALTRPELLKMATMTTAQMLFPDRKIGRFEEGAEASLLALDGNPLTDLSALKRIKVAFKQGEMLAR